jgi:TorA maturation chaperone TorD
VVQYGDPVIDEDVSPYREIAEHRSRIYWLLSQFFLERPTVDNLENLLTHLGMRPDESDDDTGPLLDELQAIIQSVPDIEQYVQELGVEYTRLFHGLRNDSGLPPPYESVHRESQLVGEVTEGVVAAYAQSGYEAIYESAGPQDHIGVELRFLSLLCFDESQFWSTGEEELAQAVWDQQAGFLTRHALVWIPAYCEALEQESTQRYFQIIADLTRHVLDHDQRILADLRNHYARS